MKSLLVRSLSAAAVLPALLLGTGCAPLNTTFETAPTLAPGKVEAQGNISRTYFADDVEGLPTAFFNSSNMGLGIGVGVAKNIDVRMRYERFNLLSPLTEDGNDLFDIRRSHFFSIAPKVSFFKDECLALKAFYAAYITKERASNSYFSFSDLGLEVLYTPVQKEHVDLTLGCKVSSLSYGRPGLSLGMGLGKNVKVAAIRPEVGVILAGKPIFDAGIGCTVVFGKDRPKK